jgi:hypothetical protein
MGKKSQIRAQELVYPEPKRQQSLKGSDGLIDQEGKHATLFARCCVVLEELEVFCPINGVTGDASPGIAGWAESFSSWWLGTGVAYSATHHWQESLKPWASPGPINSPRGWV